MKAASEILQIRGKQPREYHRCLESLGHRFVQRLVLVAHRTLGGRSKRGHHKAHQRSTTKIHVVGSIRSNGEALDRANCGAFKSLFLRKGYMPIGEVLIGHVVWLYFLSF